ncbi:MAG: hypothetical protein JXQ73_28725 [Phycisphaerae bacterium]|nr:hypothetical protein [Phycisphaerae bacterium]
MTLEITLKAEIEARLRIQATKAGKDPAAYAQEAIEEKLAVSSDTAADERSLPTRQRVDEFLKWVGSHGPVGHAVDDSRETIYEGRGE